MGTMADTAAQYHGARQHSRDDTARETGAPEARNPDPHAPGTPGSGALGAPGSQTAPAPAGRWPDPGSIHDRWTTGDLDTLPDDGLRYELIDGTLLVSPAPLPLHQRICFRLGRLLDDALARDLEVLPAPVDWQPDGTTSLQPDLLVMRTADVTPQRLLGTPLIVVEVISPSSATTDRTAKFDRYRRAGVDQYWIVDPGPPGHTAAAGPTTGKKPASIDVFDLLDGQYELQVHAEGDDMATIEGPVPTTITPTDLSDPR
jgi:Uma2 family endonuclease